MLTQLVVEVVHSLLPGDAFLHNMERFCISIHTFLSAIVSPDLGGGGFCGLACTEIIYYSAYVIKGI